MSDLSEEQKAFIAFINVARRMESYGKLCHIQRKMFLSNPNHVIEVTDEHLALARALLTPETREKMSNDQLRSIIVNQIRIGPDTLYKDGKNHQQNLN